MSGSGTFNVPSMKATGSGTFVHTDASGNVQGFGTWKATAVHGATLYPCAALLTAAKVADMRLHDLRHSRATLLLAQGVNPRVVIETLGHSQVCSR